MRKFLITAVAVVLLTIGSGATYLWTTVDLPGQPHVIAAGSDSIIFDSSGSAIGSIPSIAQHHDVPLTEVSAIARQAVLAAEDKSYYDHGAVSPTAIARAASVDLFSGNISQGGSTIAQQYIKNAYLTPQRSFGRKLREAVLAIKLQQRYGKDKVFELYLNSAYFGRGAYGIDAAAQVYFGHSASSLNAVEGATLAATLRAPSVYDSDTAALKQRRDEVLSTMQQQGWLSPADTQQALATRVPPPPAQTAQTDPYLTDLVRQYLVQKYGLDRVQQGGFRVWTTIDPAMQQEARQAVEGTLSNPGDPQGAMSVVDPTTGAVKAFYGGGDFGASQYNLAVSSRRQVGSAMKPFVLQQALLDGSTLSDSYSAPRCIDLGCNFGGESFGRSDLMQATADSINVVYLQLIQQVGPKSVAALAHQTGIDDTLLPNSQPPKLDAVPSLTLGTSDLSTLELASAYGTWANGGLHAQTYLVEKITDQDGKMLEQHQARTSQVVPPAVAAGVNTALETVLTNGTAAGTDIGRAAAGKTGTTDQNRDARFIGYTPNLVASVWVGYPDSRPMQNVDGYPQVTGATLPLTIWKKFMTQAVQSLPALDFPPPPQDILGNYIAYSAPRPG